MALQLIGGPPSTRLVGRLLDQISKHVKSLCLFIIVRKFWKFDPNPIKFIFANRVGTDSSRHTLVAEKFITLQRGSGEFLDVRIRRHDQRIVVAQAIVQ